MTTYSNRYKYCALEIFVRSRGGATISTPPARLMSLEIGHACISDHQEPSGCLRRKDRASEGVLDTNMLPDSAKGTAPKVGTSL